VRAEEIFNFAQDDLCDDDVMLLDATHQVFLWIGRGATANEKEEADALAQRYIASAAAADGRDADTPIIKIQAGSEPGAFTAHFIGWDARVAAAFDDPQARRAQARSSQVAVERAAAEAAAEAAAAAKAAALLAALEKKESAKAAAAAAASGDAGAAASAPAAAASPALPSVTIAPGTKTFALAALKGMDASDGIAPDLKEAYLTDADFQATFAVRTRACCADVWQLCCGCCGCCADAWCAVCVCADDARRVCGDAQVEAGGRQEARRHLLRRRAER
jgi:hypothetical protein